MYGSESYVCTYIYRTMYIEDSSPIFTGLYIYRMYAEASPTYIYSSESFVCNVGAVYRVLHCKLRMRH